MLGQRAAEALVNERYCQISSIALAHHIGPHIFRSVELRRAAATRVRHLVAGSRGDPERRR